jgi:fatty-acyl-CoA synthase
MNLATDTALEMDWLKRWARLSPNAVAFKDAESGVEYTYAALHYLSCKVAQHLQSKFGIQVGQRVAVISTNEIEYLPLFFALQRLGAIMVPVNFRLTAREITHILKDCSADLLVHQIQFNDVLAACGTGAVPSRIWSFDGDDSLSSFIRRELVAFTAFASDVRKLPEPAWTFEFSGEFTSACMILYTSGTTGSPKGALVTNAMLHWNSLNTTLRLNISENDVQLSFLPFFHTGGWNVLLTPFVHRGARTVIMKKFDPDQILRLCQNENVTILFGVPTTMEMMHRSPLFSEVDLSTVRYAIVGGEPMPLELIKVWQIKGVPIRQGYGLTEFGPNVFSLNQEDAIRKIGSIGFANFYVQTKVVDANDREVGVGEVGELLLKGPVCTPGYWRNAEATAQTIEDGWLHTGDLVRFDDEGYFYVAGRKKDMFISGGENVYPIEVEQVLGAHSAIREVAVIGVPDSKWGEVGKAFVALKAEGSATVDEILEFCASRLAKFKIPKQIEFVAELPKGDSGKILKRKLREA